MMHDTSSSDSAAVASTPGSTAGTRTVARLGSIGVARLGSAGPVAWLGSIGPRPRRNTSSSSGPSSVPFGETHASSIPDASSAASMPARSAVGTSGAKSMTFHSGAPGRPSRELAVRVYGVGGAGCPPARSSASSSSMRRLCWIAASRSCSTPTCRATSSRLTASAASWTARTTGLSPSAELVHSSNMDSSADGSGTRTMASRVR
jgi:hypothetical protein